MADIHLLRTFLAVYRAGTVTRAAHDLHVTQPAVSVQLRSLETQLGKPLFRRMPRGVVPTAAGRELAQAVASHLDALEGAMDSSTGAADAVGATVYIGGPEEFLSVRVMPELAPFMSDGLHIRMFFGVDAPVLDRLIGGELDLAVLTVDARRRGIDTLPLSVELLELVATPAWARRLGRIEEGHAGAHALRDVPISTYDEDLPLVQTYWQLVFDTTVKQRAVFVANSLRASLQFARRDVGITVLPAHTTSDARDRGELVRLLEPSSPPRSRLHLAWRSGDLRRPSVARVHSCISLAAERW